jgi:hypothetical protein
MSSVPRRGSSSAQLPAAHVTVDRAMRCLGRLVLTFFLVMVLVGVFLVMSCG